MASRMVVLRAAQVRLCPKDQRMKPYADTQRRHGGVLFGYRQFAV